MSDIEKPRQELCDELSGLTSENLMNIPKQKRAANELRIGRVAYELTMRLLEQTEAA